MSHTPGPWKVFKGGALVRRCGDLHPLPSEDTCLATERDAIEVIGSSEWMRVTDDDMRLMAAAPELLAMLVRLVYDYGTAEDWQYHRLVDEASALIAKAEGP